MTIRAGVKPFPLRLREEVYDALKKWSDDELRSMNGQIEYILEAALKKANKLSKKIGVDHD